ncbi:MAG: glycosyltransferase [Treponema sp.]|jgi:glycosyltransferase involved in cell wall biosynthesis|nr:glycosyltransferase [Treponema sp.]
MGRVYEACKKMAPLPVRDALRRPWYNLLMGGVRRGGGYKRGAYEEGVNLIGLFGSESGTGQGCRLLAGAMEGSGAPFDAVGYQFDGCSKIGESGYEGRMVPADEARFGVNVAQMLLDGIPPILVKMGRKLWDGRYNIAHIAWELPAVPDRWRRHAGFFDEIWTTSAFSAGALQAAVDRPVYVIPYGMTVSASKKRGRPFFHLPEKAFLFLFMYDANSLFERKNPMGAVRAFQAAFGKGAAGVGLVVKINDHLRLETGLAELKAAVSGWENIRIIDEIYGKGEVDDLVSACDAFVSLHRSEGYGLSIAEAMLLGKPVVVTGWSGNMEFTNGENACVVGYELVKVGKAWYAYDEWQYWAEPDIQEAALYMRRLYEDKGYCEKVAAAGRRTIEARQSVERSAREMRRRLERITGRAWGAPMEGEEA